MLDYILSKMVLLIFLLLLVSAFTLVQRSLDSYFAQQAARSLASNLTSDITRIVTTVRSTSELRSYALPPVLEAGSKRIPYDLNIVHYKVKDTCYVGVLVMDHARKRPIAYDTAAVGDARKVKVYVCGNGGDVFLSSAVTEQQYFILERSLNLATGEMALKICASTDPATGCAACTSGGGC